MPISVFDDLLAESISFPLTISGIKAKNHVDGERLTIISLNITTFDYPEWFYAPRTKL